MLIFLHVLLVANTFLFRVVKARIIGVGLQHKCSESPLTNYSCYMKSYLVLELEVFVVHNFF